MAYFAPGDELSEALEDAARRDVDVELIPPGFTDSWFVLDAGRSHYAALMKAAACASTSCAARFSTRRLR